MDATTGTATGVGVAAEDAVGDDGVEATIVGDGRRWDRARSSVFPSRAGGSTDARDAPGATR